MTILGIAAVVVSWAKRFSSNEMAPIRALLFMLLSFIGLVAIPHAIFLYSWQEVKYLFFKLLTMGIFYVGGSFIYVSKVPERIYPGKFDYFHSHFIWHMFVLAATYAHYISVYAIHNWRHNKGYICG